MGNQKSLENDGIVILNPQSPSSRGIYVVLGAPRGGTSMIAGSLHIGGIPMGERVTEGTYEDSALIAALAKHDLALVLDLIETRNKKHTHWGWKQPTEFKFFFDSVLPNLADVKLLVVFRDVFAVGKRNKISAGQDLLPNMRATLFVYSQIVDYLIKVECPVMLVSYEKALLRPDIFVNSLIEFMGIEGVDGAVLTSFITPSPTKYLKSSYILDGIGRVDSISSRKVSGWASWRDDRSLMVELLVNKKLIGQIIANRFRKDVMDKGLHVTGNCGFVFDLSKEQSIMAGDIVTVRIKSTSQALQGVRALAVKDAAASNV